VIGEKQGQFMVADDRFGPDRDRWRDHKGTAKSDPKRILAARRREPFLQFSALCFRATMRLINLPDDTLPTCSSSST
jgi:hypothetical protein